MKFFFSFLLFIFFVLVQYNSFAKLSKTDSLEILLENAEEDTNKVNILNLLCNEYLTNDAQKSKSFAENALLLANSLTYKKGIAIGNNNLGNVNYLLGNYEKALEYYFAALKIRQEMGNKKAMAASYSNIGNVYKEWGDYSKSLEYYFKALKIQEEIDDPTALANTYNNIGLIYYEQNNYDNSLEYHEKALKLREKTNDKKAMAISYSNLGIVYSEQNRSEDALKKYFEAVKILEELEDKRALATTYNNIGTVYSSQKKSAKANEYFLKGLKIIEEMGDKKGIASAYNNLGEVLKDQDNYFQAIEYLNKGLTISIEIGTKAQQQFSYKLLSETYSKMSNFKNAYKYHQLYSQTKDSLFNEESSKQITEMQTKYETEKKEQQIKLLNKDKEIQTKDLERQKTIRNAVAGGLILVLLFSFVLINRFLLIKKQKKIIEVEREKSEKLLLNILPKETADELKLKNAVTPKRYDQVTVMFTDFKGFTTIAEKMSAEELVSELDFIFKKFDEIISKYPIEKIKTIGDAYMCAGGLPTPNESNPMDVVLAALEIQEFMEKLAVGNPARRDEEKKLQTANWKLRIGIHTGSVIAGVVGDKKFAYDIWGDTVNTASRMESSGEAGKVNISGETYRNLTGFQNLEGLKFTFRGKIPAKNKGEIEMYFVEKC